MARKCRVDEIRPTPRALRRKHVFAHVVQGLVSRESKLFRSRITLALWASYLYFKDKSRPDFGDRPFAIGSNKIQKACTTDRMCTHGAARDRV